MRKRKGNPILASFFETQVENAQNINDKEYDIEIEFSFKTGLLVTQIAWHESQKAKKLKNGNVLIQLKCGINAELVGWVVHWMAEAEVKKPRLLRELVIQKYVDCLEVYGEGQQQTDNS